MYLLREQKKRRWEEVSRRVVSSDGEITDEAIEESQCALLATWHTGGHDRERGVVL
jgi:hypothetical protein